jgi:hypothetical protein
VSGAAPAAPAAGPGPGDAAARVGLARARLHSRNQVMFLAVEFLLGMAVNLLGLPSETTGAAHAATIAFLAAHTVVAAGLLAGAFVSSGPRRWRGVDGAGWRSGAPRRSWSQSGRESSP